MKVITPSCMDKQDCQMSSKTVFSVSHMDRNQPGFGDHEFMIYCQCCHMSDTRSHPQLTKQKGHKGCPLKKTAHCQLPIHLEGSMQVLYPPKWTTLFSTHLLTPSRWHSVCASRHTNSEIIRPWNASHFVLCFTKIIVEKVQRIRSWSNAEARWLRMSPWQM